MWEDRLGFYVRYFIKCFNVSELLSSLLLQIVTDNKLFLILNVFDRVPRWDIVCTVALKLLYFDPNFHLN